MSHPKPGGRWVAMDSALPEGPVDLAVTTREHFEALKKVRAEADALVHAWQTLEKGDTFDYTALRDALVACTAAEKRARET